ncbi:hypothetical protein DYB25_002369 [Aphanomyces astaci]|uniref:Uncharacterized protein n=1 Tax=Aphanomyces astaci TaxID=112090 RepID=A0A397BIL9_APHAT|nr:hypothetical protein DYB25_002369 [Aphanomyces astaci]
MTSVQALRLETLGNAQMALIKTLQDDVGNLTKQFALFTAQPCAKSITPAPATSYPHSYHQRVATNEGDTQSKCNQTHEDENRRLAASLHEANTKLSAQDKTMRQLQADNDELQALLRAAGRDLTREEGRVVKLKQHIESLQQTTLMPACNNQHEPSSPTSPPRMGKRTAPLRFG